MPWVSARDTSRYASSDINDFWTPELQEDAQGRSLQHLSPRTKSTKAESHSSVVHRLFHLSLLSIFGCPQHTHITKRRNCNFEISGKKRLKVKLFTKIRSDKRCFWVFWKGDHLLYVNWYLFSPPDEDHSTRGHQTHIQSPLTWWSNITVSPRLLNEPEFSYGWASGNLHKGSMKIMKKDTILHLTSYIPSAYLHTYHPRLKGHKARSGGYSGLWTSHSGADRPSPISRFHKI